MINRIFLLSLLVVSTLSATSYVVGGGGGSSSSSDGISNELYVIFTSGQPNTFDSIYQNDSLIFDTNLDSASYNLDSYLFTIPKAYADNHDENFVWTNQTSGITTNLFDTNFIDENNGWAVGAGGTILHTTNGGDTWSEQDSGTDNTPPLLGVHFVNATTGWVMVASLGLNRTAASLRLNRQAAPTIPLILMESILLIPLLAGS